MPDEEKPITEHIAELVERARKALIVTIGVILAQYVVPSAVLEIFGLPVKHSFKPVIFELMIYVEEDMLNFTKPILRGLKSVLAPGKELNVILIASGMFDAFIASFYLSLLIALFLAGPVILWEVYAYVKPALYPHEERVFKKYFLAGAFLFVVGAAYAYFILLPLTFFIMTWIAVVSGAEPIFTVSSFFHTVLVGVVLTGLFFMFPLVFVGLVSIGLINARVLREKWRYVVLGVFAFTAIVTPDPTPITMTLMALPFTALYGITVLVAERIQRKRAGLLEVRKRSVITER